MSMHMHGMQRVDLAASRWQHISFFFPFRWRLSCVPMGTPDTENGPGGWADWTNAAELKWLVSFDPEYLCAFLERTGNQIHTPWSFPRICLPSKLGRRRSQAQGDPSRVSLTNLRQHKQYGRRSRREEGNRGIPGTAPSTDIHRGRSQRYRQRATEGPAIEARRRASGVLRCFKTNPKSTRATDPKRRRPPRVGS